MKKIRLWQRLIPGFVFLFTGWLFISYGSANCSAAENEKGGSEVKYLSENLLFNGGFEGVDENKQPKSWTITPDPKKPDICLVEMDTTIKHRGKSSLKITVREETEDVTILLKSLSFTPNPNKLYRVTGWVKQENFAIDREVGFDIITLRGPGDYWNWRFSPPTMANFDWRFVEQLVGPATTEKELALTLGLHVYKGKPIVWFDDFKVQEYNPPEPPAKAKKWVYPARSFGVGGHIVDDPDGNEGKSFKVTALEGAGNKLSGPIISDQPAGLYRSTYRLKIADTSKDYALGSLGTVIYPHGMNGGERVIWTHEFTEANKYQEFTVDFILPAKGIGPVLGIYGGSNWTDLWIDKVTVTQLLEFTDESMQKFYGD